MQPSLYWAEDGGLDFEAQVLEVRDGALRLDANGFYPGGGGQPCDRGSMEFADGARIAIAQARRDEGGQVWLHADDQPPDCVGARVRASVDRGHREAVSRHHTALHVLNTIALRSHDAWITGCQIGAELSRIDFKVGTPLAEFAADLQAQAAAVIAAGLPVRARFVPEAEFGDDYLRTLEARPPVLDGRVRVVEIEGFDAQACGGTHAHNTAELGVLAIVRTENKGRINKRLYVRLG